MKTISRKLWSTASKRQFPARFFWVAFSLLREYLNLIPGPRTDRRISFAANALAFYEGAKIVRSSSEGGNAGTVYAIVFLILDAAFVMGQFGPFIQSFAQAADAGKRILSLIDYPDIPIDVYSKEG